MELSAQETRRTTLERFSSSIEVGIALPLGSVGDSLLVRSYRRAVSSC
jgi:hypothetical protein